MKTTLTLPKDPKPGLTFHVENSNESIEIISPDRPMEDRCLVTIGKGDSVIIESVVVNFEKDHDGNLQSVTEWMTI